MSFDFSSVTDHTDRYNFHSHTQWCDGRDTAEHFAEAAVAAGMEVYGFSPHSPVPIVSPCNMSMEAVSQYLQEIDRLQRLHGGRIRLLKSMEIDYLGPHWGPASSYFQQLPLDYRIGSIHFIAARDGRLVDIDGRYEAFRRKMAENFHDDINYVVETFFDRTEDMIRRGGFDIIGHIDKIAHNASHYKPGIDMEPWFEQRVTRVIEMCAAHGITVEINTKQWEEHHRMFPDPKWMGLLKRLGLNVVINSDAHRPALIDASRSEALRMFAEA